MPTCPGSGKCQRNICTILEVWRKTYNFNRLKGIWISSERNDQNFSRFIISCLSDWRMSKCVPNISEMSNPSLQGPLCLAAVLPVIDAKSESHLDSFKKRKRE
jgi:hypothetical protein